MSEREKNFWAGYGAFLKLYESVGVEREDFIKAMGALIEESDDEGLVSDLVYIAMALDITLDESVERLRISLRRFASSQVIKEVIKDYQATQKFRTIERQTAARN